MKKNAERNIKCGINDRSGKSYFQGVFWETEELIDFVYISGPCCGSLFALVLWALFCAVLFLNGFPGIKQMKVMKMLGHYRQEASSQHGVGLGSQVKELGAVCWGHLWGHEDGEVMDALRGQDWEGGSPTCQFQPSGPWADTDPMCALFMDTRWVPRHLAGLGI